MIAMTHAGYVAAGWIGTFALLGGYAWSSRDHADSDEMRMWAWCKATMLVDKQGKVSCSPAYPGPAGK